jgi:hypothetical protein
MEAQNDVLQNFIQRGANVHIAIRERRPIMQNELRRPRAAGLDAFI